MPDIFRYSASILANRKLFPVIQDFASEAVGHPKGILREALDFYRQGLHNWTDIAESGVKFETHSHTKYSDGEDVGAVVNKLFSSNYGIWAPTDHNDTRAFDLLKGGKHNLSLETGINYSVEPDESNRYLTIRHDNKNMRVLRSVEYMTEEGELLIHGFSGENLTGEILKKRIPAYEAIAMANADGGFIVIPHPYFPGGGIGRSGNDVIAAAAFARGNNAVMGIERNATQILPQMSSNSHARRDSEGLGIPLIAGGDSHTLDMYARSGIAFDDEEYEKVLKDSDENHADAIKELIAKGSFHNFFNYVTPRMFIAFFKMDNSELGH